MLFRSFNEAGVAQYVEQAKHVLNHYKSKIANGMPLAKHVNFNFMARGEPLANKQLLYGLTALNKTLSELCKDLNLTHSLNISSIIPMDVDLDAIAKAFEENKENLLFYYSLYSLDLAFRKKWLPKALPADKALDFLAALQQKIDLKLILHWALIKGHNDSLESARNICESIQQRGLRARFNLVRYNPYSYAQGEESQECSIQEYFEIMKTQLGDPNSRIVPKVGFDVKASCGMFVSVP